MIHCDHEVLHRKTDIVVIHKKSKLFIDISDIACLVDDRIVEKELKKGYYDSLK